MAAVPYPPRHPRPEDGCQTSTQYRDKGPKADSPKAVCRLAAFLLTPTFFLLPEKDV